MVQLSPGASATRQSRHQYRSLSMGVLVLKAMDLASVTYLRLRSSFPERACSTAMSISRAILALATPLISLLDMRLRDKGAPAARTRNMD